jgi:hypothetical protein
MNARENPTRKGSPRSKFCLREERRQIEAKAKAGGQSVAGDLVNVGIGYQVRGIVDHRQVEELARINGDLGRLGGLLKLWLTDDERTADVGKFTIRAVLSRIEATQDQMLDLMKKVIAPKPGHEF